tara:strand:- start:193 stop:1008 length:816 start_codon:yes stop_codon:yes gene_type:complete
MVFSRHIARKRFGQHWLNDESVLDMIISAAELQPDDRVLEIGPGRGALTERLLNSEASLIHAIELDRDLVTGLKKRFAAKSRFALTEGDVLSVPLKLSDGIWSTKVVANIPYNITGPLLERLIGGLSKPAENIYKRLVILLQKEVADRILAKPGESNFSAISVRFQLLAKSSGVCLVPPKCFQPAPKVYSKVILIEPFCLKERIQPEIAQKVEILLNAAFRSRRKMLRNTLGSLPFFDQIEIAAAQAGISLRQRPQEISSLLWIQLAQALS